VTAQHASNGATATVRIAPDGVVAIEAEGRAPGTLVPRAGRRGAWSYGRGETVWTIGRGPEHVGGFVLEDGTREIGRTTPVAGPDGGAGETTVLLEDGRAFRLRFRPTPEPRVELAGWETRGAYLEARPHRDGWTITATPAGRAMGMDDSLLVLMTAELCLVEDGDPE